jgi:hypothetical protein
MYKHAQKRKLYRHVEHRVTFQLNNQHFEVIVVRVDSVIIFSKLPCQQVTVSEPINGVLAKLNMKINLCSFMAMSLQSKINGNKTAVKNIKIVSMNKYHSLPNY